MLQRKSKHEITQIQLKKNIFHNVLHSILDAQVQLQLQNTINSVKVQYIYFNCLIC